jgi:hypothetical protein
MRDEFMCESVDENIEEISDYVMTSIQKTVLDYNIDPNRKLTPNEAELEKKIKMVEQSDPTEFGLTKEELSDTTWRSVKNEIYKI